VILAVFGAYMFGGGFGCIGSEACEQVRIELERLVDNVNAVCQDSTLGEMGEAQELPGGEYNFEGASVVHVSPDGTFKAQKFKDPDSVIDIGSMVQDGLLAFVTLDLDRFTSDWSVSVTAEECEETNLCVGAGHVDGCHSGFEADVADRQGRSLPFFVLDYLGINALSELGLGEAFSKTGRFTYYTPDDRVVNLDYRAIQIGGP
jgi:hypothetical protein